MTNIQLHNNDCMSVFPELADNSIDLTLTDIPYDEVNRIRVGGLQRNWIKVMRDIITFPLDDFIDEVVRVTWIRRYYHQTYRNSSEGTFSVESVQVSHIRNRLIEPP